MPEIRFENFPEPEGNAGTAAAFGLLEGSIQGIATELQNITGPFTLSLPPAPALDIIILILQGRGAAAAGGQSFEISGPAIVRPPFGRSCALEVEDGQVLQLFVIRKETTAEDIAIMDRGPDVRDRLFALHFRDCPQYREKIKSEKTINTTILPGGIVPRVAIGAVDTEGPDEVAEHEHPMLEQQFLGLTGCRCMVHADGARQLLTANLLLHIPSASKHAVTVEEGDRLYYIWLDYFQDMEGEKHLESHLPMEDGE